MQGTRRWTVLSFKCQRIIYRGLRRCSLGFNHMEVTKVFKEEERVWKGVPTYDSGARLSHYLFWFIHSFIHRLIPSLIHLLVQDTAMGTVQQKDDSNSVPTVGQRGGGLQWRNPTAQGDGSLYLFPIKTLQLESRFYQQRKCNPYSILFNPDVGYQLL